MGRGFGASGVRLSPPVAWAAVRSEAIVLFVCCYSHCGSL